MLLAGLGWQIVILSIPTSSEHPPPVHPTSTAHHSLLQSRHLIGVNPPPSFHPPSQLRQHDLVRGKIYSLRLSPSPRSTYNYLPANKQPTTQKKKQASRQPLVASNYHIPALSLTITEGTIARWKLKECDTEGALLEIKTDKAQTDLKALDDGILFTKLMVQAATGAVPVSSRIT